MYNFDFFYSIFFFLTLIFFLFLGKKKFVALLKNKQKDNGIKELLKLTLIYPFIFILILGCAPPAFERLYQDYPVLLIIVFFLSYFSMFGYFRICDRLGIKKNKTKKEEH